MTNYERIKNMSLEEMVMLLSDLSPMVDPFSSIYCNSICPIKVDGHCPIDDDDEPPCAAMTHQDDVQAWLEAEAE